MEQTIAFPTDNRTEENHTESLRPFTMFNSRTSRRRECAVIVAMARDRAIGKDGGMPWHIPADLKHFKRLTMGHPVVMGRRTWQSLPAGALPGRRNIVVSRNPDFFPEGAEKAASIEEALAMCAPGDIPFIIGGGQIYAEAISMATRLYITLVDAEFPDADTRFPEFDREEWTPSAEEMPPAGSGGGYDYRFIALRRKC